MSKTVIMARVSTREQAEEGYSLESQRKLLESYGLSKGFNITRKFITPESASGRQERKQFNEMIDFLHDNPDVKILLCEKVDRATRNFKDAQKLDDWINEDSERQIHFVKQNLIIHKNAKSHEKFQWDIYLVLAKQYSNNLSEETKKGLTEKASQNSYPGNSKRGYKTVGEVGRKMWLIDTSESSEAPFIKRAFELYDSGEYTTHTLGKALFKEGWKNNSGKPLGKSQIHLILKDCFYCGEFVWNKKHYANANHEPLISKELFYRVQDRIEKKVVGKSKKKDYLFNNLIKCGECSRSVCGETHKLAHYYRCTRYLTECTQKGYTREDKVEEQVIGLLEKLHINNERLAEWLQKALKESHADEVEYHISTLRELNHNHARTMQKMDTLYDEKIEQNITPEFYAKKFKQYSEELEEIVKAIAKHKNAGVSYVELGSSILDLTQRAREIYTKATPEKKRKLLSIVFAELHLKDKTVVPIYNKAFQFISERVNTINTQDSTLELEMPSSKAVILESDKKSDDLLGYKDSNLDTQDQNLMSYH